MAISLRSTREAANNGVKICVYGQAGAGKTTLISTAPDPVILSAESGLLSLNDHDIPFYEIRSVQDMADAYMYFSSDPDARQFRTICIDSISEIAEICLNAEKEKQKDPRKAYGEMADTMKDMLRRFRDLPYNIYVSAQMEKVQDDTGLMKYGPSTPGQQLGRAIPYVFDEVFALRVDRDQDGSIVRWLQTTGDRNYDAKDRSGRLAETETADLTYIINKIKGEN